MEIDINILFVDATASGKALAESAAKKGHTIFHLLSGRQNSAPLSDEEKECWFQMIESSAPFQKTFRLESEKEAINLVPELRKLNLDVVIPGTETGVFTAEFLAEKLNIPANPFESHSKRRNKFDMQNAIKEAGIKSIPMRIISNVEQALDFFNENHRAPVVVKPISGEGAENTVICDSATGLTKTLDKLFSSRNFYNEPNIELLIQAFIPGDEYVVNTVSRRGKHAIVDVWLYNKIPFYENDSAYLLYDSCYLVHTIPEGLADYTYKVLDALEITEGAAHSEIKMNNEGPVLIETGARIMGKIPLAPGVGKALGYRPSDVIIDAYASQEAFESLQKKEYKPLSYCVYKTLISKSEGELKKLGALELLPKLPSLEDLDLAITSSKSYISKTVDLITTPGECTLLSNSKEQIIEDYKKIRFMEEWCPQVLYEVKKSDISAIQKQLGEETITCIEEHKSIEEIKKKITLPFSDVETPPLSYWFDKLRVFAQKDGDRLAYVEYSDDEIEKITYSELWKRSQLIAEKLKTIGVSSEDTICFQSSSKIKLQICMIACVFNEIPFHLIDTAATEKLIVEAYRDVDATLFVGDALLKKAPSDISQFLMDELVLKEIDEVRLKSVFNQEARKKSLKSKERHFKYLQYLSQENHKIYCFSSTSGSTGKPKILPQTRQALRNFIYSETQFEKYITDNTKPIIMGTLIKETFVGFCAMMHSIFKGNTIIFLDAKEAMNPALLGKRIDYFGITDINVPPAILNSFIDIVDTSKLHRIITGGDKVNLKKMPDCQLVEALGMSENFAAFEDCLITSNEDASRIDFVFPNSQIYIMNEKGSPALPGETGEIWLSTQALAAGYYNNFSQTTQSFSDNPFYCNWFMPSYLHRVYKTGDYAQIKENGDIYFVGRKDNQVQIAGKRVELSEIETVAKQYPGVQEVAAIARREEDSYYLVLFFTAAKTIKFNELRAFFAQHVASYKIPRLTIQMDVLPLNRNSKIDRKKLSQNPLSDFVAKTNNESKGEKIQNQTIDSQEELKKLLEEITSFPAKAMNSRDSVFELGIDSVNALRLIQLIINKWGVSLSPQKLLTFETIYNLDTYIQKELSDKKAGKKELVILGKEEEIPDSFEPSFSVQNILLEDKLEEVEVGPYHNPFLFEIRPDITYDQLEEAINFVFSHQPNLSSTFDFEDDSYRQKIDKRKNSFSIERFSFSSDSFDLDIQKLIRTFNLRTEKPFHIAFVDLEEGNEENKRRFLFLDIHHAVFDGTSLEILISQLERAFVSPETLKSFFPSSLGHILPENGNTPEAEKFWKKEIQGISEAPQFLSVPQDNEDVGISVFKKGFGDLLSNKIAEFAREHKITKFSLLLTTFEVSASLFAQQKNLSFAVPFSGRTSEKFTNAIGMFVKTLPVSFKANNEKNLLDYINNNFEMLKKYLSFQDCDVIPLLKEARSSSDVFSYLSVLFAYKRNEQFSTNNLSLFSDIKPLEHKSLSSDLIFYVHEIDGELSLSLEFSRQKFKVAQMETFASCFLNVLTQILKDPFQTYAKISLFSSPEEAEKTNAIFLSKELYSVPDSFVISEFDKQVEKYPDETALVYVNEQGEKVALTYRELQYAAFTIAKQIKNETNLWAKGVPLGIVSSSSRRIIMCILGILYSGNSFVYIDPTHPESRIKHILDSLEICACIGDIDVKVKIMPLRDKITFLHFTVGLADITPDKDTVEEFDVAPQTEVFTYLSTSGSTGIPKAFPLSQKGMLNEAIGEATAQRLSPRKKYLILSSPSFDMFYITVIPTLLNAGEVWVLDESIDRDLVLIHNLIEKNKIENMFMTTQLGEHFINFFPSSSLGTLTVAGEALKLRNIPNYQVINAYGPAEAGIVTRYYLKELESPISLGKPVNNMFVGILDTDLRPLPPYVLGELYISGPQLTSGYIGKGCEGQNAISFCKKHLLNNPSYKNLYSSGDLGFYDERGLFYYHGRKDFQVKINGVRIQPEEIEQTLLNHEGIDNFSVVAAKKGNGHSILALFYQKNASYKKPMDKDSVKTILLKNLPESHVPALIHEVDVLPISTTGKINKKALKEMAEDLIRKKHKGEPLKTKTEIALGTLIASSLSLPIETLTREVTFEELGVDSIRSMALSFRIQKQMGVQIIPKAIISAPSIKYLAKKIEEAQTQQEVTLITDFTPSAKTAVFVHTANTGSEAYRPLAKLLNGKMNLYVVEPHNIFHPENKILSIEDLASFYRDLLEKEGLANFDYIGGWSFGGNIAFEMAVQYEQQGEPKKLVFLLDPMFLEEDHAKQKFIEFSQDAAFLKYLENDPLFEHYINLGLIDRLVENQLDVAKAIVNYSAPFYNGRGIFIKSLVLKTQYGTESIINENVGQQEKLFAKRLTNLEDKAPKIRTVDLDFEHDNFMSPGAVEKIASWILDALDAEKDEGDGT